MNSDSLDVVREVHQFLRRWLDDIRKFPDPSSLAPGTLQSISGQLTRVDVAVRAAPAQLLKSGPWRDEVTGYAKTLGEVHARLGNLQITLSIQRAVTRNACNRIDAIRSWADLVRHIG